MRRSQEFTAVSILFFSILVCELRSVAGDLFSNPAEIEPDPFRDLSTTPVENPEKMKAFLEATKTTVQAVRSTMNCTFAPIGTHKDFTTCSFSNIILFNGKILFVTQDVEHTVVPRISLDWLAAGNLTHNESDYKRGLLENYLEVVHPLTIPVNDSTIVEFVEEAAFVHFVFYFNYYHVFAEYAPSLHNIICKYMGKCRYDPSDLSFRLFLTSNADVHKEHVNQTSLVNKEFVKCITRQPVINTEHGSLRNKLLVIKKAVIGWGHECRADHAHCLPWDKHRRVPAPMMQSWRDRVASCMDFNPAAPAPLQPIRILVIDRDFTNGRTVLNMKMIVRKIRRRYDCHKVEVVVHQLEDLTINQQAALYNNATIVVWLHGAAMANLLFLPTNATAVQVVHRQEPPELFYWVEELVRDLPNSVDLHHVLNTDPDRVVLMAGWVTKNSIFPNLTKAERLIIWEQKKCPHPVGHPYRHTCDEFFFKVGACLELDPQLLFNKLDPVVMRYLKMRADLTGTELQRDMRLKLNCDAPRLARRRAKQGKKGKRGQGGTPEGRGALPAAHADDSDMHNTHPADLDEDSDILALHM